MSVKTTDYLAYIKDGTNQDGIARQTGVFFKETGLMDRFQIVKHQIHPRPYRLIYSEPAQNTDTQWTASLATFAAGKTEKQWVSFEDAQYRFIPDGHEPNGGYIIRSEKRVRAKEAEEILQSWISVNKIISNLQSEAETRFTEEQGNLISQLVHDVQAVILLSEEIKKPQELEQRLRYQKKINKNITCFVRDTELLKIAVSMKDMIQTALELLGEKASQVKISSIPSDTEVELDTELFARAFSEIVKNAIIHNNERITQIQVDVKKETSGSPFIPFDWVKVSISDNGKGIPPDFLPLVKNPFFTTRKQQGASGFGLTLAEKIIRAHSGHLEIESSPGKGTRVVIYLPGTVIL